MRLSRDKVNKLAHTVADALATIDSVDFVEDRNTIRMEARRLLEDLLKAEEMIDKAARMKIENQKRTIMEGTQEWDILYRKYYNEEVKKLGDLRFTASPLSVFPHSSSAPTTYCGSAPHTHYSVHSVAPR